MNRLDCKMLGLGQSNGKANEDVTLTNVTGGRILYEGIELNSGGGGGGFPLTGAGVDCIGPICQGAAAIQLAGADFEVTGGDLLVGDSTLPLVGHVEAQRYALPSGALLPDAIALEKDAATNNQGTVTLNEDTGLFTSFQTPGQLRVSNPLGAGTKFAVDIQSDRGAAPVSFPNVAGISTGDEATHLCSFMHPEGFHVAPPGHATHAEIADDRFVTENATVRSYTGANRTKLEQKAAPTHTIILDVNQAPGEAVVQVSHGDPAVVPESCSLKHNNLAIDDTTALAEQHAVYTKNSVMYAENAPAVQICLIDKNGIDSDSLVGNPKLSFKWLPPFLPAVPIMNKYNWFETMRRYATTYTMDASTITPAEWTVAAGQSGGQGYKRPTYWIMSGNMTVNEEVNGIATGRTFLWSEIGYGGMLAGGAPPACWDITIAFNSSDLVTNPDNEFPFGNVAPGTGGGGGTGLYAPPPDATYGDSFVWKNLSLTVTGVMLQREGLFSPVVPGESWKSQYEYPCDASFTQAPWSMGGAGSDVVPPAAPRNDTPNYEDYGYFNTFENGANAKAAGAVWPNYVDTDSPNLKNSEFELVFNVLDNIGGAPPGAYGRFNLRMPPCYTAFYQAPVVPQIANLKITLNPAMAMRY